MQFLSKILLLVLIFINFNVYSDQIDFSNSLMKADEIYYDKNKNTLKAEGNVFINIDQYFINADKIFYYKNEDLLVAKGNVHITDYQKNLNGKKEEFFGETVIFKNKLKKIIVKDFVAKLDKDSLVAANTAKGDIKKKNFVLKKAAFTPCQINCKSNPIWQINASDTEIDYSKQKMIYKNAFFEIYGIPVFYLPYFSYALPNSDGRTGVLVPRLKNDNISIPIYFRPKSNLDFTIAPRISRRYTIFDGEFRHKIKEGQYSISGSYAKIENESTGKDKRYDISLKSDLSNDKFNYGFDINRASDKAYLANYNGRYDNYLTSRIYANSFNYRNYFLLESFIFQDFSKNDKNQPVPLIFPKILTQTIYSFDREETLLLNNNIDITTYDNKKDFQLFRTSVNLELMKIFHFLNGGIINSSVSNRFDLYSFYRDNKIIKKEEQKAIYRNIPELKTSIQYPFFNFIGKKSIIKFEPKVKIIIGEKYQEKSRKFQFIDSDQINFSESNIYQDTRYSGIDNRDYGTRLSYGLNTSLLFSEDFYLDSFLGKMISKNNVPNISSNDYVGNMSANIAKNLQISYSFQRNRKLKPVRHEAILSGVNDYLKVSSSFVELYQINKLKTLKNKEKFTRQKVAQLIFDIDYKLTNKLWIGTGSKIDISESKKRVLTRTMRMTYIFDCVSMNASITDNFFNDDSRGVRKDRNYTISVGLKVINM